MFTYTTAAEYFNISVFIFIFFGRGCCLSSNRPKNYLCWLKIIFRLRTDLSHRNQLFVYINLKKYITELENPLLR